MKKIFAIVLIGLAGVVNVNAQEKTTPFSKSTSYIQAGVGLGAGYYVGSGTLPPVQIRYEKGVSDEFSVGGVVGIAGSKYSDSYGSIKYTYTLVGVRGNYHFDVNNEKIDAYVGGTLGYNVFSVNDKGYTYSGYTAHTSAVLWGGQVGANYYFNTRMGAWAELGYGIGYLNLGITFKL